MPETEPVIVEEKVLDPEKVLESARSVEEAAVIVMFPVPSKETPLMFLAVWRAVAVEALPVILVLSGDDVLIAYDAPPLAPTRPVKVASVGALVNVCVPPHVLDEVVPKRSEMALTLLESG